MIKRRWSEGSWRCLLYTGLPWLPCPVLIPTDFSPPQLHNLYSSLRGPEDSLLQLNFRPTKPLHGRVIEVSFSASTFATTGLGMDRNPRRIESGVDRLWGNPPPH